MEALSSGLFSLGTVFVALGFAAHVGHAVMLANGRRTVPVIAAGRQPAYAGIVTGSFVTAQAQAASSGPNTAASPSPALARRPRAEPRRLAGARGVAGAPRGHRRSRAVGQHVRVHRRLRLLDDRRLPVPAAPLRDPLDRVPAARGRAGDAALRLEPAVRDQAARAGPAERAAAHDPRRDGRAELRHLRDQLRGRRRPTWSRARTTGSPGSRRTRSSTRRPIERSSSASRSSPR